MPYILERVSVLLFCYLYIINTVFYRCFYWNFFLSSRLWLKLFWWLLGVSVVCQAVWNWKSLGRICTLSPWRLRWMKSTCSSYLLLVRAEHLMLTLCAGECCRVNNFVMFQKRICVSFIQMTLTSTWLHLNIKIWQIRTKSLQTYSLSLPWWTITNIESDKSHEMSISVALHYVL